MKKCLLTILVLTSALLAANAQQKDYFGPTMKKSQLIEENRNFRKQLDSLRNVVDSLKANMTAKDKFQEEPAPEVSVTPRMNTLEATDSLVNLWMEKMTLQTFVGEEYNMDSVKFTSDVPDSVFIKRLAAMNPYFTLPYNETVKNYMILYSEKMPSKMGRLLGLSKYYMPIFEETLAKYGLPLELKYLSIIESALNPTAVSRSGATGMWQFMYKTGRGYGLRIDSFVDERMDVEKSADAAARYLQELYSMFGDWSIAISSYNCGPGTLMKAIKRAGSSEFWDLYPYLPKETRGYMPAFVGAMYAMTYYKEYGLKPEDVGMPAATDTIEIKKNLHFQQINEVVGVPMEMLKTLNPQYIHEIIPGASGPSKLSLPINWTIAFLEANQDSLYNHKASQLVSPQIIRTISDGGSGDGTRIAYKVKSGDYLGRIATKNHVTVDQIKKWNHLKSTSLRVGQVLYLYPKGTAAAKPQDQTQTQEQAQQQPQEQTASAAVNPPASAAVPVEQPAPVVPEIPKSAPDTAAFVPVKSEVADDEPENIQDTIKTDVQEPAGKVEGRIVKDTLDIEALLKATSQSRANQAAKAAAEAAKPKSEQTAKPVETKPASTVQQTSTAAQTNPEYTEYTVKKGDTLFSISKRYGVQVQDILSFNKMTSSSIQVGMKLRIPSGI